MFEMAYASIDGKRYCSQSVLFFVFTQILHALKSFAEGNASAKDNSCEHCYPLSLSLCERYLHESRRLKGRHRPG